MAELLHGSARTTPRVRAELQASQESTRALAARYGLNSKTVAKWRRRSFTADAPMGPSDPRSTVLTAVEEAMIVEFRRRTLLPLDDVLGCLRDTIPRLTRSALHRYLQRHGISRLPETEDAAYAGPPDNGSGSQPMVQGSACPHSRAPSAPRPGWSHHSSDLKVSRTTKRRKHRA